MKHHVFFRLLFAGLPNLRFLCTANLLLPVLTFLSLFPCGSLDLHHTMSDLSVFWLEFLGKVKGVINKGKACCFATTKLCAESEAEYHIRCCLVHRRKFLTNFSLRNCSTAWM